MGGRLREFAAKEYAITDQAQVFKEMASQEDVKRVTLREGELWVGAKLEGEKVLESTGGPGGHGREGRLSKRGQTTLEYAGHGLLYLPISAVPAGQLSSPRSRRILRYVAGPREERKVRALRVPTI